MFALLTLLVGSAAALEVCPEGAADIPFQSWACVQRAKLVDSLEGRADASTRVLGRLVHNELTTGDPALSEALFHLAEVRWAVGDVDGARDALDRCVRTGVATARCASLRSQIDLDVEAVGTVPLRWTFATADHGFFHPRPYWDKGTMRLREAGDQTWLSWSTRIDPLKEDRLVVGFREPSPTPTRIVIRMRSGEVDALIQPELRDTRGHVYALADRRIVLPVRRWVDVEMPLAEVVPLRPSAPPFDPARLHRLVLRDVTALTGTMGRNEIQIDAFTVE